MNPDVRRVVTTKALINGEVVIIDLASTDRNAYSDIEFRLKYLGQGRYHSYNDHPANDKTLTHFWIQNEESEHSADASNAIDTIKKLTDTKNAFIDAYKTSCDQFAVMAMEIIELRKQKSELIEAVEKLKYNSGINSLIRIELDVLLEKCNSPVKKAVKS